jgi:hypothetical protein
MVQALSKPDYDAWVAQAKTKFAKIDGTATKQVARVGGTPATQVAAVPAN